MRKFEFVCPNCRSEEIEEEYTQNEGELCLAKYVCNDCDEEFDVIYDNPQLPGYI